MSPCFLDRAILSSVAISLIKILSTSKEPSTRGKAGQPAGVPHFPDLWYLARKQPVRSHQVRTLSCRHPMADMAQSCR